MNRLYLVSIPVFLLFCTVGSPAQVQKPVRFFLSKADRSALFTEQKVPGQKTDTASKNDVIDIDPSKRYQTIDGFGFALTGGSAQHIIRMDLRSRTRLLQELFDTTGLNIGVSYLRVSIGASDLNEKVFSYDDLPPGKTDPQMQQFDLGPDKQDVIPVLKEILAINPRIKIMGSPWSPPTWMKTNNDTRGGRLIPDYYAAYATYLTRYILGMEAAGIAIDAITVQNEPLHPGNNPSLLLTAPEEAEFIKKHLGPAFKKAGVKTKIVVFDHNADRIDYPLFILKDEEARKYVDGAAFHLYAGKIEALSEVHNAFPEKNLYFTEQMVVERKNAAQLNIAGTVSRLVIGATRNWCRNVLEWNLAADPENKPYTDRGGCSMCQGAVTIDGNEFNRNLAYYSIAHASKFVRPGSIRVASTQSDSIPNVAFRTPRGHTVLIVANTSATAKSFTIRYQGLKVEARLDKGSVGTYVW